MQIITTIKDPRIIEARVLVSSSGRRRIGKCLLAGVENIRWALQAKMIVEHILVTYDIKEAAWESESLFADIPVFAISEGIAKKITDTSYVVPEIGVMRLRLPPPPEGEADFVVVLDNVKDFGNIGTIVRSAAAFGIRDFVSSNGETDFFNKKTIDASRGAVFRGRLREFDSASRSVDYLKRNGFVIIATSPHAAPLQSLLKLPQKPIALIIGNETNGISKEFEKAADHLVRIPMTGDIESLNVGVAAGISIYEINLKRILSMLVSLIRSTLGRQIGVAMQLITTVFDIHLKKMSEFDSRRVIFMMMLRCDGVMSRKQAMNDCGLKGEEFEAFLKSLIERKVLVSLQNGEHFQLTGLGEEYLAKMWPIVESVENKLFEGFREEEKAKLDDYLNRIHSNCMKIMKES